MTNDTAQQSTIFVGVTHLKAKSGHEQVRLQQGQALLEEMKTFITKEG